MKHGDIEEWESELGTKRTAFASGSEGIWTFIFIDMVIFSLIFLVFTSERVQHYDLYETSHHQLNVVLGFVNTLILLTSSLYAARSVHSARTGHIAQVSSRLSMTLVLGIAFCASKGVEYYTKIESGISISSNSFFTFYFFITFLHLLHVVAGTLFILLFRRKTPELATDTSYLTGLENVGLFWHFVDLLWVFIYALLYLI